MSNKDVQPNGSQAAALAAFQAELASAQLSGNVELCQYWAKHIVKNANNQYYARA